MTITDPDGNLLNMRKKVFLSESRWVLGIWIIKLLKLREGIPKKKQVFLRKVLFRKIEKLLLEIQDAMFQKALRYRDSHITKADQLGRICTAA